jgi:hypothetical protein
LNGTVTSLHLGDNSDLSKDAQQALTAELGGFAGDRHQGPSRSAWEGEYEPAGTLRRNERQWSAISVEELAHITQALDLSDALTAAAVGANLCVEGLPEFSLLPRGTKLVFPSGAVLLVEEYNPPCTDMGAQIAAKYRTRSGQPLNQQSWLRPAAGRRGVVGVVDVPGVIRVGDCFEVRIYQEPMIRPL